MDNFLFLEKNVEAEQRSKEYGFTKTLFLNKDFVFLQEHDKKKLLQAAKEANRRGKVVICQPKTEEILRFVLEKTPIDIVIGIEQIHGSDRFHYVRGGLDQVLCAIAKQNNKTIAFSFREILVSPKRSQLLARMRLNISLCEKYNLPMLFGNFCTELGEMKTAKDLQAFWRILH